MPETSRPFERLHFDIIGGKNSLPFNSEKYRYILVVIDDFTRYKWAFPLNRKSQAVLKLQWLIQTWKSQFREFEPVKVAYLHSDDASEWTKGEFVQFMKENGITLEVTAPYSPEQNGLAERTNRTVIETLRSILIQSKLPENLWHLLLPLAIQQINLSPKPNFGKQTLTTPHEELFGKPSPLYPKLRPCGTLVWVTYGSKPAGKMPPQARPMAYIGHKGSMIYILWDGVRIHHSRDIRITNQLWIDYINQQKQEIAETVAAMTLQQPIEPTSYQQAISLPEAEKWRTSMEKEYNALKTKDTWIEVPKKEVQGQKILSGKWVYKIKNDGTYKSRWVIRGFEQQLNPWDETRAAVVQGTTTRILLALAAKHDWDIEVIDVDNAFLNGVVPEHREIYLQMPTGYSKPGTVCKLQKTLYGLKEAALAWYITLRDALEELGLKASQQDECLFMSANPKEPLYVTAHVDDIKVCGPNAKAFKQQIQQKFRVKPHNFERYLGLDIKRDRAQRTIHVSQASYTASIIKDFGHLAAHSNVPLSRPIQDTPGAEPTPKEVHLYQQVVGKLMHLACQTRPDIHFAIIQASRYNTKPPPDAWRAISEILGYISRTPTHGITIQGTSDDTQLQQYSDASFATGTNGRSISGRITLLNGTPITWQSKQQTMVATSTCHSEYIAAYEATLQAIPIQDLLQEIVEPLSISLPPPTLCVDNTAAITTANKGILTRQNRHFLTKYYWLHEQIEEGNITVKYVNTKEQLADSLTKPVIRSILDVFCKDIQLHAIARS